MKDVLETVLWILVGAAGEFYRRAFARFSEETQSVAPEVWKKLTVTSPNTGGPAQQVRDFIWKREYLSLENQKLRELGGRARLANILLGFSGVALVEYYFFTLVLLRK